MGKLISGVVLPLLLLTAALLNWSLISLIDLLAFLYLQYNAPKIGSRPRRRSLVAWYIFVFSLTAVLSHAVFYVLWIVEREEWSRTDAWWAKTIGLLRGDSMNSLSHLYFLATQILIAFTALVEISGWSLRHNCFGQIVSSIEILGSHLRVVYCIFLPAVQLLLGISYPSWVSLPYFICSSIGLVDWSLTSNFLGLFRWWRYLLIYAATNIILLYFHQLPLDLPETLKWIAKFLGFYKISTKSDLAEVCSSISLIVFYYMLTWIRCDIAEMDVIMSEPDSPLTERLIPAKHSFFIRESRSGVRHTNLMLRGAVFRTFSINFFTYGFPISLFVLSWWSVHFTSVFAFGLLAYVGYILYAFPSLFHLHRLNGLLLVFILLWAASTYVFNVAFTVLNKKLQKDMEIWETIGLWHYPIPGCYLLAQFGLGVLVALGNLVSNSVFTYLSDGGAQSMNDSCTVEEKEETKVLIIATLAWGLRKSSRAIMLALIFLIATKPGFIHAIYMVFFMIYLLSHTIGRRLRQSLILLCELHFAILYILQLNIVTKALEREGSAAVGILSELGLLEQASSGDLSKIAVLAGFCAIHNHGFETLFSFSVIVQHTPRPPFGFSILKAGLSKSVILSVYTSSSRANQFDSSSHERKIASYLTAIGHRFLASYRSCGTYIALLTILLTVYLGTPNYTSFGYLFFLISWMVGRQLVERTKRRMWFPLKLYAVTVLIFIYSLHVFTDLRIWMSSMIDLTSALGYDPDASLWKNIWESLAIVIVLQLYSYERRESKYLESEYYSAKEPGVLQRILILHSDKILLITLLNASLSPISAFGFLYLLGLVVCSILPKTSRLPSKVFLVYSGLLTMAKYLFQMLGNQAKMFPGEERRSLSVVLGFRLFENGFLGLEHGLRGEVLVIVSCILQYNVFHWLYLMPEKSIKKGKWEEPCDLFNCSDETVNEALNQPKEYRHSNISSHEKIKDNKPGSFASGKDLSHEKSGTGHSKIEKYSYSLFWESSREKHKWNKRRVLMLRKERFDIQKATLKVYLRFWIENLFNLFGLEINMIALLLASFAVLNAISLLYIVALAACILLHRHLIRKMWPLFVLLFASVLTLEYISLWLNLTSPGQQTFSKAPISCHECWRFSDKYFEHCKKCWLGIIVDDPRMLISYCIVFLLSCFKLRSDHLTSFSGSRTYREMVYQWKHASVLSDLSFETKTLWTILDYMRLYIYCHLLDLVLTLILATGTLEYDILHLGYLGFALVFFRMRLEILQKKNGLFKYLRMYNFGLIVFSLAYQSPLFGDANEGKCDMMDYISEVIGFHKYDYGFRITSRSALVEIVIFMLVSLQSCMFSSKEFDYVYKYLEAEQIGAIVREQEKKAAWKTAQLQHIRKCEEQKRLRNMQVEKIKSEMLNLQTQLHGMNSFEDHGTSTLPAAPNKGLRRRNTMPESHIATSLPDKVDIDLTNRSTSADLLYLGEVNDSLTNLGIERFDFTAPSADADIPTSSKKKGRKFLGRGNAIASAVHLIGDGVSHVQSLGSMAVTNLVNFLHIEREDDEIINELSSDDEEYYEIESQVIPDEHLERTYSVQSNNEKTPSDAAILQIGLILRHVWGQMRSNNDVVCYCCFVLIFLWNFSLLSMVYLAALFLYALCVNTGPTYLFWIIMLIYTEVCILLQYLYQIIIQHCSVSIQVSFLTEIGFPELKIKSFFVISNLPLFLVYLFTLLQTTIIIRNGEWTAFMEQLSFLDSRQDDIRPRLSVFKRMGRLLSPVENTIKLFVRNLFRYWKSLTEGAETPPHFVQLSMEISSWPEDGIQPERIESGITRLLSIIHDRRWGNDIDHFHPPSRVRIQSIEKSPDNDNIALAVFEVIYASPLNESVPMSWYKSLTPAADVAFEILQGQSTGITKEIGFRYPILSVIGGGKREVDLYSYIFCADMVVFFLVAVFYQSVIKNNSEFLEVYQLEDQFPKEFVFLLMILFFLIVLDRIIYLCSFTTVKVLFYVFNLALFTYSVTKYAWYMEPTHKRIGGVALRAIYLSKAVSLALQAIQLKYGIPHKSTLYRQFLTSSISKLNYMGFRVYRALPFLYELRCVLDWSCTTTSLTMYDWLKLEDIHASLFLVKCDAVLNRSSHKQGQKQTKMTKFCNGICLFFVLICVIWAPMLMYSSGNPTNIANPIKDARVWIDMKTASGRLTLFETTLCEKLSWDEVDGRVKLDPKNYLGAYNEDDIQLICCQADASTLWGVPPIVQARFIQSLHLSMNIIFSWQFTRDRPKGKEVVKYELVVQDEDLPSPDQVVQVINGSARGFTIFNVYPRYFRVTGSGDVRFLEQAVDLVSGDLVLNRGTPGWWSFQDRHASNNSACGVFGGPMAIIVSEETPQGILGETLSKFSIWGLYITFVLAVGRFIRLQCSDLRMRIPFENLPSCDRLLAICEDIYASRAEGELEVEEVLYWTLVKIYRSPHMLLEYTKPD
ncbi:unnamed protein product [Rhodiola kirilowii]